MGAVVRDFIAEQAVDFQNRHHFGYVAAVHLEDAEDEMFWDGMLQDVRPGRYDYIYFSKSNSGNDTRGCEQCLRYKEYLNDKFFICIDSDLRLLLGLNKMSSADYIAQTYTYSWENHYCFAGRLQALLSEICREAAEKFDFQKFLKAYSNVVYPALLFLVSLKRNGLAGDFESEFNRLLQKQCTGVQMQNNGELLVEMLSRNMHELCESHPLWDSFDMSKEVRLLGDSSLTEDNAYLYVRGHNVIALVSCIGTMLCSSHRVSFVNDVLYAALSVACDDLQRVKDDLKEILK